MLQEIFYAAKKVMVAIVTVTMFAGTMVIVVLIFLRSVQPKVAEVVRLLHLPLQHRNRPQLFQTLHLKPLLVDLVLELEGLISVCKNHKANVGVMDRALAQEIAVAIFCQFARKQLRLQQLAQLLRREARVSDQMVHLFATAKVVGLAGAIQYAKMLEIAVLTLSLSVDLQVDVSCVDKLFVVCCLVKLALENCSMVTTSGQCNLCVMLLHVWWPLLRAPAGHACF